MVCDIDSASPGVISLANKCPAVYTSFFNEAYRGRSCGPGGIQFLYGEGPRDAVTYMSYFPVERDMFIFPAWLKHWVSPFKSDCTRISVSGNIHDSAPLNNITKFGPEYVETKKDDSKT